MRKHDTLPELETVRRFTVVPKDMPKLCHIDDAISKTKFGLFNYILILLGAFSLFVVIMEGMTVSYILPVTECDLRLSASEKGILSSVFFAGMIVSSHLWGFLADTKGRRRVIQPTLLLGFIMSVIVSFVENFYVFAVLRFLNGFFVSGCSATIFAYICEFHDKKNRARALMMASIIYGALCISAPLIAWISINQTWEFYIPFIDIVYKPWRFFIVVNGLPELISFLIITFLPESPRFVLGQGKPAEAYAILQKMDRINNGNDTELDKFEIIEETESAEYRQMLRQTESSRFPILSVIWLQTAKLFQAPHLFTTILICIIQFCIFFPTGCLVYEAVVLNKMSTNLDDFINERAMMCDVINMKSAPSNATISEANVEVCNTKIETHTITSIVIIEVAFTLGFMLTGSLINKYAKFPILVGILVVVGGCGISCMLHQIPILQIAGYLMSALPGIAGNVVSSATVEIYPTALRAMAICISLMFARFGGVVGSQAAALLLENHCEMVFYLPGASLILAAALSYFIPRIHEKVEALEESNEPNVPRASVFSARMK